LPLSFSRKEEKREKKQRKKRKKKSERGGGKLKEGKFRGLSQPETGSDRVSENAKVKKIKKGYRFSSVEVKSSFRCSGL